MVIFNLEEVFKQQQRVAEAEMTEMLGEKTTLQLRMSREEQRFVASHQSEMEDLIEPFVAELTRQASNIFRNEFFNIGIHHLAYLGRLTHSSESKTKENVVSERKTKRQTSSKKSDRKEPMERRWTTLNNLSVVGGEKLPKKSKSRMVSTPKKNKQKAEKKAQGPSDPIGMIIRDAEQNVFDANDSYNEAIFN